MTAHIKVAEIGGTGNRQSFEKIVADLAHLYIKDNAPSLMQGNYEQGFQLLEKSDDDTKAVGVVGFNVNQMQIYCPVFFLNGEIKGNELMYLADQDLFVPVKEAWLNKIMGKKPIVIGEGIGRDQHRQGYSNPDLSVFKESPTKYGSYYPSWVQQGLPAICRIIGKNLTKSASNAVQIYKQLRKELDIKEFAKLADKNAVYHLKTALANSPLIKQAFVTMYGNSEFLDKIYNAKDIEERGFKIANYPGGVRTDLDGNATSNILDDTSWIPDYINNPFYKSAAYVTVMSYTEVLNEGEPIPLSESERERMVNKGYLVLDSRKDKDVSSLVTANHRSLVNPTEAGLYDVLMADGTSEPRICIPCDAYSAWEKESTNIRRASRYWVIKPTEDGRNMPAFRVPKNNIWCGAAHEAIPDKYTHKATEENLTKNLVILIKDKQVLGPIQTQTSSSEGIKCYAPAIGAKLPDTICDLQFLEMSPKGSGLRAISDSRIQVPPETRVISIDEQYESAELGDISFMKTATAGVTEDVKLYVSGDACYINGQHKDSAFTGLCSLIKDFGLREKDAESVMKQANSDFANGHTVKFTIKRAASLDYGNANSFNVPNDGSNQTGNMMGTYLPLAPSNTNSYTNPSDAYAEASGPYENTLDPAFPAQDAQNIMRATQNGQQEVFDVSMLKQLITNVNTSDRVDEISSKLVRAMDNVGRLLFLFYWKGDDFQEMYGPQELPELEGGLRKSFETLGDLVLFLQRKSTKPITYSGESVVNLTDIKD